MRALLIALLVLLASARAAAEPAPIPPLPRLNIREPARVCTLLEPVRCRDLPPGVFTDAPTWDQLDADRKVEQNDVTRLTAENASLRKSVAGWQPGWKSIAVAVVAGISIGVYGATRF